MPISGLGSLGTAKMPVSRNAQIFEDTFPPIESYGFDIVKINNNQLAGIRGKDDLANAKFNGCLFKWKGKTLLLYRCYSRITGGRGNLAISELSNDYKTVLSNKELNLSAYGAMRQYEDGRLFEHNGELYISYVVVDYSSKYWAAIRVSKLDDDFNEIASWTPQYGYNMVSGAQKNWIFFSHKGTIKCIYHCAQALVLSFDENFNLIKEDVVPGINRKDWGYGQIRGGTQPYDMGDFYLSFFHGSTVHGQRKRRYNMTPYAIDKKTLGVVAIGREPIIYASTENGIVNESATWWVPIVIFPMGAIDSGATIDVSCGVNDLYTAVIKIDKTRIWDLMMPINELSKFEPQRFFTDNVEKVAGVKWESLTTGNRGRYGVFLIESAEQMAKNFETIKISKKQ